MNLASNLTQTTSEHADRVAVRLGESTTTFRDLDDRSARVAGLLQDRGVKPGDRVAIMLPNLPEFAVIYYGVLRAGGVVVPMNPLLKAREVAYYLGDSGARLIFAWDGVADEVGKGAEKAGAEVIGVDPATFTPGLAEASPVHDVVDRDAQDTAVILYTSGTTGQPKGAELTHANLTSNVEVLSTDLMELTPRRRDLRRAPVVPLVRADLHPQRCGLLGCEPEPAAEIRPDAGPAAPGRAPRDGLRRGADDVRGSARPAGP